MPRTKHPSEEVFRNLVGDNPLDTIAPLKELSDAFCWLEEVFKTIANEAHIKRDGFRAEHLAKAGAHIAFDMSQYAGSRYEDLLSRLRAAGVIPAEGEQA